METKSEKYSFLRIWRKIFGVGHSENEHRFMVRLWLASLMFIAALLSGFTVLLTHFIFESSNNNNPGAKIPPLPGNPPGDNPGTPPGYNPSYPVVRKKMISIIEALIKNRVTESLSAGKTYVIDVRDKNEFFENLENNIHPRLEMFDLSTVYAGFFSELWKTSLASDLKFLEKGVNEVSGGSIRMLVRDDSEYGGPVSISLREMELLEHSNDRLRGFFRYRITFFVYAIVEFISPSGKRQEFRIKSDKFFFSATLKPIQTAEVYYFKLIKDFLKNKTITVNYPNDQLIPSDFANDVGVKQTITEQVGNLIDGLRKKKYPHFPGWEISTKKVVSKGYGKLVSQAEARLVFNNLFSLTLKEVLVKSSFNFDNWVNKNLNGKNIGIINADDYKKIEKDSQGKEIDRSFLDFLFKVTTKKIVRYLDSLGLNKETANYLTDLLSSKLFLRKNDYWDLVNRLRSIDFSRGRDESGSYIVAFFLKGSEKRINFYLDIKFSNFSTGIKNLAEDRFNIHYFTFDRRGVSLLGSNWWNCLIVWGLPFMFRHAITYMGGSKQWFMGNPRFYTDLQTGKRYAIYVDRIIPMWMFLIIQGIIFNAAFTALQGELRIISSTIRNVIRRLEKIVWSSSVDAEALTVTRSWLEINGDKVLSSITRGLETFLERFKKICTEAGKLSSTRITRVLSGTREDILRRRMSPSPRKVSGSLPKEFKRGGKLDPGDTLFPIDEGAAKGELTGHIPEIGEPGSSKWQKKGSREPSRSRGRSESRTSKGKGREERRGDSSSGSDKERSPGSSGKEGSVGEDWEFVGGYSGVPIKKFSGTGFLFGKWSREWSQLGVLGHYSPLFEESMIKSFISYIKSMVSLIIEDVAIAVVQKIRQLMGTAIASLASQLSLLEGRINIIKWLAIWRTIGNVFGFVLDNVLFNYYVEEV